jgi:hypothetical protein
MCAPSKALPNILQSPCFGLLFKMPSVDLHEGKTQIFCVLQTLICDATRMYIYVHCSCLVQAMFYLTFQIILYTKNMGINLINADCFFVYFILQILC